MLEIRKERDVIINLQDKETQRTTIVFNQDDINSAVLDFHLIDNGDMQDTSVFTKATLTLQQNNRTIFNGELDQYFSIILPPEALGRGGNIVGQLNCDFQGGTLATPYFSFFVLKSLTTLPEGDRIAYINQIQALIEELKAKIAAIEGGDLVTQAELDAAVAALNIAISDKAPTNHKSTGTTYGVATATEYGHVMSSNALPLANGTASAGTAGKCANEGHVHPTDTTRAPIDNPTFTGITKVSTATRANGLTQALNFESGDANYAPAGFGLGDIAKRVTGDWDEHDETGWYSGYLLLHSPPYGNGSWYVQSIKYSDVHCVQLAWYVSSPGTPMFIRNKYSSVWSDWDSLISQGAVKSWLPEVYGSTVAGTPTYTSRLGYFYKTGKLITLICDIRLSNIGGLQGNVLIKGLPAIPARQSVAQVLTWNNSDTSDIVAFAYDARNYINLYKANSGNVASPTQITHSFLTNATVLSFTLQHVID